MDINTFRKFPEVFDEYVNSNDIDAEIVINYDLPYYLNSRDACYKFSLSENFFDCLPNKKRALLINIERKWHEHQSIALRESTFSVGGGEYGFQSTSVQIFIEIFKEEIEEIDKVFNKKEFFSELMQKTLELLIIKYNINKNGNYFINASASDCSMICIFLYKNWINLKETINGYISPNTSNSQIYEIGNEKYEDSLDIDIYRYFFNKAKYSSNKFDYIDTIVSGAIALESFIYYVLRNNISTDRDIELYTFDSENNKYYSAFQLIRKLIEDGYLINKNDISYSKIRQYTSDVLSPRNDLMHGKLREFTNLKNKSIKSRDGLIELFNNLEQANIIISQGIEKEITIKHEKIILKRMIKEALKHNGEERERKLKEALEYDKQNCFIYLELGSIEMNKGRFDMAINFYEEALKYTTRKDELLNNIAIAYTRKGDYSIAIEYFGMVTDTPKSDNYFCKDRYLKEFGECYLLASRSKVELDKLGMNKNSALKEAEKLFKDISNIKYNESTFMNLAIVNMEMERFEEAIDYYDKILNIEGIKSKYNILKYKAYCYLRINNIKKSIEIIEQIITIYRTELTSNDIKEINELLQIVNLNTNHEKEVKS
ncbi:tetratricopeptide repeat protein [Clostridium perfringens]|nr:tetratricopeptide repeat protein [Clostridium perfringens]